MRNAGLDEAQARIKSAGRNINNLRYADDTTLMAESEEELNSLLMKVKEENEKAGLKLGKLRSWHPVPLLQGKWMGKQWKQWETLFWGLQNHCRWWLQPWNLKTFAPWKKSYDQPRQHIKKQRHYFADKVRLIKAMVFPVVMYGDESWTIRKAECQRIDAFELWYWRRLLRAPWTARRSNQSILKDISPEYSL